LSQSIDYTKLKLRPFEDVNEAWGENCGENIETLKCIHRMMSDYLSKHITIKPILEQFLGLWIYIDQVPIEIKARMDKFDLSYCNNVTFNDMCAIAHIDVTYISNINNRSFESLTKEQVLNLVQIKNLKFSPITERVHRLKLENFREASILLNT